MFCHFIVAIEGAGVKNHDGEHTEKENCVVDLHDKLLSVGLLS
jgi:hypothetical protein